MNEPYKTIKLVENHLNCESSGSCGVFALWTTRVLLKRNYSDFKIVFGWVHTLECLGTRKLEHIWIELNSGEIIDPTRAQFPTFVCYAEQKTYHNPEEILDRKGFSLKEKATAPWIKYHLRSK